MNEKIMGCIDSIGECKNKLNCLEVIKNSFMIDKYWYRNNILFFIGTALEGKNGII